MAGSIKLFSFNRKYYHVLGIYPSQSNENGPPINSRNCIFIISFLLIGLSSAAFFVFEAKSMFEYVMSFFSASSAVLMTCTYIVIILKMKNTWSFIENCERFIEKRESSVSAYRVIIAKIEQLCGLVGIAMFTTFIFGMPSILLYSLINYYVLDFGEKSFYLIISAKMPFDWKTPLGYFVAWLVQTGGCVASEITSVIFLNFILGSCWLFLFMAEDITKDLAAFNIDVKANANRADRMKCFCDIIQIYSDAKECLEQFNAIVKYSLFTQLFLLMLAESSLLLLLQFQLLDNNAKLIDTVMLSVVVPWIFVILFFICEIGERMSYHFGMFGEELERCEWHKLPVKTQRMYLIFLSDTQQPKNITCYGNILLTRETFKKISNKAWSYFTALRKFKI